MNAPRVLAYSEVSRFIDETDPGRKNLKLLRECLKAGKWVLGLLNGERVGIALEEHETKPVYVCLPEAAVKNLVKEPPMMICGHSANGYRGSAPVCLICIGRKPEAEIVDEAAPAFLHRVARCHCGKEKPSRPGLAFFEHLPNAEFDRYYCGCDGWD